MTRQPSPTSKSRRGFTLVELLIVMGILVVISSMAMPQLMSLIRENHVTDAAEQVRKAAAEARKYAIDTGIDYEFRYEVNGSAVIVLPAEQELNTNESGDTSNTTEKYIRLLAELPEDFRLHAPEGVDELSETLEPIRFGDLTGDGLTRKSWSAPTLFRFDGTTSDFQVLVSDEEGLTSTVSIRGLTGSVRTSAVYQEDP